MNIKVDASGFENEVKKILKEYGDKAQAALEKSSKAVAQETAKRIKSALPRSKHSGRHYANGWRVVDQSSRLNVDFEVYNATKPGLTHLLEDGHAKRNGGWQNGTDHIRPQETWAIDEIQKRVLKELEE